MKAVFVLIKRTDRNENQHLLVIIERISFLCCARLLPHKCICFLPLLHSLENRAQFYDKHRLLAEKRAFLHVACL